MEIETINNLGILKQTCNIFDLLSKRGWGDNIGHQMCSALTLLALVAGTVSESSCVEAASAGSS